MPVQRYHADRAQELRSKPLVHWLRTQGIHPSWTPGECPAGNRAELSVQNLKAGTRKLLLQSHIGRHFWPLALLHASARNWVSFGQALGIPQPPLLPFGISVEARKRAQTGLRRNGKRGRLKGFTLGRRPIRLEVT